MHVGGSTTTQKMYSDYHSWQYNSILLLTLPLYCFCIVNNVSIPIIIIIIIILLSILLFYCQYYYFIVNIVSTATESKSISSAHYFFSYIIFLIYASIISIYIFLKHVFSKIIFTVSTAAIYF